MLRCLTKRLHYLLDLCRRGHVNVLVPYLYYHSTYDRAVSLRGSSVCGHVCDGGERQTDRQTKNKTMQTYSVQQVVR